MINDVQFWRHMQVSARSRELQDGVANRTRVSREAEKTCHGSYDGGWLWQWRAWKGWWCVEFIRAHAVAALSFWLPILHTLSDLPFACFICKQAFVSPVVTRCGHYFCEQCAIDRCRETRACAACGKNTSGVFNPAKDIIEKMKAAKQTASAIWVILLIVSKYSNVSHLTIPVPVL